MASKTAPVGTAATSDSRYDSIGSTIYPADSRQCAYAEVLLGFRQQRASVAHIKNTDRQMPGVLGPAG